MFNQQESDHLPDVGNMIRFYILLLLLIVDNIFSNSKFYANLLML